MSQRLREIKLIGTGLALLYGISFVVYMIFFMTGYVNAQSIVMAGLLAFLFIASLAVVRLKEWGRMALVLGNAAMGVYLILPYLAMTDIIPLSFIFLNVALLLFFNQNKIKAYFSHGVSRAKWRSILLVDDDPTLIKLVRPLLISNGFAVLTAETGEEGFKVAKRQKPDMIILDVILPGKKGREVCSQLKDDPDTRDIPVLFLTAKDSQDDVEAEKAAGAVGHLTKPVQPKELLDTINKIVAPG